MSERVLIVDDDPTNVEKLYSILQSKQYEIAVANNGERAYKVALNFKPDIVLMDVLMPGWDGYETTRVFKSDPQLKDIPIIFVTAKMEEAVKAFDVGAADYVGKPFNNAELEARLDSHIKTQALWKKIQATNVSLQKRLDAKERQLAEANSTILTLQKQLGLAQSDQNEGSQAADMSESISNEEFEKQFNNP